MLTVSITDLIITIFETVRSILKDQYSSALSNLDHCYQWQIELPHFAGRSSLINIRKSMLFAISDTSYPDWIIAKGTKSCILKVKLLGSV